MGSPLAPILANLFMGHYEKGWLENFDAAKVYFYRRYVDDTFFLLNNLTEAKNYFNSINSKHINIPFTRETKVSQKLPFLNVLIDK